MKKNEKLETISIFAGRCSGAPDCWYLLVPIVRIRQGCVPFSDDYGYGYFAKLGTLWGKISRAY